MGLTAVLNDTPEKAKARGELLALLNSPDFKLTDEVDDPSHFSSVVEKALAGGVTRDRLSLLTGVDDTDDVAEWALGSLIPDPRWQNEIVAHIKAELARVESAVDHD